jgi:hypothetical protein
MTVENYVSIASGMLGAGMAFGGVVIMMGYVTRVIFRILKGGQ